MQHSRSPSVAAAVTRCLRRRLALDVVTSSRSRNGVVTRGVAIVTGMVLSSVVANRFPIGLEVSTFTDVTVAIIATPLLFPFCCVWSSLWGPVVAGPSSSACRAESVPPAPGGIYVRTASLLVAAAVMVAVVMGVVVGVNIVISVVGPVTMVGFHGGGSRGLEPGATIGEDAERCLHLEKGVACTSTERWGER